MQITRRVWVTQCLGVAALAEAAAAQQHAHEAARSADPPAFRTLDPGMAAEIDALTSQIVPSDDSPGAHEAGVVYFIDTALTTFDADLREPYQMGMQAVQRKRVEMFPSSASIVALSGDQRNALLHAIESDAATEHFFELLRTHTLFGLMGNSSYGGNRDHIGWKLIGFDDRMAFQPPFGYYDAHPEESAQ